MAFLQVLADDVVKTIFDEDFGFSDGDESEFEGGNDIYALLGELDMKTLLVTTRTKKTLVRNKITMLYIEMPETSAEIEDEREGSSCVSLLGDTCTVDPCLRRSRLRVTGGERQCRDGGKETQNILKLFSTIGVN